MKSEPSKWLPILLSLVAVGISSLSWWESHRGRVINEETNRPQLRLEEKYANTALEKIGLTLKNVGKTPAKLTKLILNETHTPSQFFPNPCLLDKSLSFDTSEMEILPGDEVSLSSKASFHNEGFCLVLSGEAGVEYRNSVTGVRYFQSIEVNIQIESKIEIVPFPFASPGG